MRCPLMHAHVGPPIHPDAAVADAVRAWRAADAPEPLRRVWADIQPAVHEAALSITRARGVV